MGSDGAVNQALKLERDGGWTSGAQPPLFKQPGHRFRAQVWGQYVSHKINTTHFIVFYLRTEGHKVKD